MHEFHDEDLILELRNDRNATDAEISARLDGCEQCIADLAEQDAVASFLADLDTPSLSGTERAALRSAVLAEIEPAPVIPLSPRRSWDWTRLGTVAAALVGVVAVAGLFSVIGDGAGESEDATDTVAAADSANVDTDALALEAAPGGDGVEDDAATEEAADDFAGASIAAPSDLVFDFGARDLPGFAADLEDVRARVVETTESSGVLQRSADEADVSCIDELPDPGAIRAIVTALVDGLEVEVYFDSSGGEFAYASMDCSAYDLP